MALDLVLMRCDRQRVTLSTTACARMWRSAADRDRIPHPWESRHHCIGCPIGAENAGESPAAAAVAAAVAAWSPICPRCGRVAQRMIRKALCVSCYNRQREADRGKNAKGSRPRICSTLHRLRLAVRQDDAVRVVRTDPLLEPAEALIRLAQRATGPFYVGVPAPAADALGGLLPQQSLGLELLLPAGTAVCRGSRRRSRPAIPMRASGAVQAVLAL